MSSSRRRHGPFWFAAVAFLVITTANAQQPASTGGLACPATIDVNEAAKPIAGWSAVPATKRRDFERVSIYNGEAGGQEYDLAPDDEKQEGGRVVQTWSLKGYRSMNLFLRCRYHDTAVVLQRDIPAKLETCSLRFTIDKKGTITGQSELKCR